jgi:hypothetical protein
VKGQARGGVEVDPITRPRGFGSAVVGTRHNTTVSTRPAPSSQKSLE